jgi:hypothetical protein
MPDYGFRAEQLLLTLSSSNRQSKAILTLILLVRGFFLKQIQRHRGVLCLSPGITFSALTSIFIHYNPSS